eukprot:8367892-Pyramimonas_sp.AAC.1
MASVVLLQEFVHISEHVEAVASWCGVRGWRLMALPSLPTSGSVPSAGVAGAVRDRLGLRPPAI